MIGRTPLVRLRAVLALSVAASGVVCAGAARTALASPPANEPTASELQAARSLFAAAERDEDNGRWVDALDKLHKVATVKMTPGVRFHIALCEENLGHLAVALAEYTAAESLATREKNKEVLDSLKAPLAGLKERVPELTLNAPRDLKPADPLHGEAQGFQVSLDGRPIAPGVVGVPLPVDPGPHRIDATAPGRVPFSAQVTLAERDHASVDLKLPEAPRSDEASSKHAMPQAAAAPVASGAGTASGTSGAPRTPGTLSAPHAGATEGTGTRAAQPPSEASPPARRTRSRATAIAATGGAVALAGAGVAFFVMAGNKRDDAFATCDASRAACGDDLKTGARTFDALALGAWIGAGAISALAVVLWASPPRTSTVATRAPRTMPRLLVGPGAAFVAGEF